ncbi:peptidyl-prolyl cis-trans isomerase FKBP3-like isoform X2 [Stigmatopora argus]
MNQEVVWESIAKQLRIDDLPTKDPIKLSQDNAGHSFLNVRRLLGNIKNVAKKEQLFDPISSCLSAKFKATDDGRGDKQTKEVKAEVVDEGPPKFTKCM